MDKETLSNYGWIVICVMVLAVMLALASPFGNFVADAIKSTTQGLFDVNQGALQSANINIMQQEFEEMLNGNTGAVVPDGFTYTIASTGEILPAGQRITAPNMGGDMLTQSNGDYVYTLMKSGYGTLDEARTSFKVFFANTWRESIDEIIDMWIADGMTEDEAWELLCGEEYSESGFVATSNPTIYWAVSAKDQTKSSYGQIQSNLLGYPVTSMECTFMNCTNLVTAPEIPSSITNIDSAFFYCSSLENVTIPSTLTSIDSCAFKGCTKLNNIVIPSSINTIGICAFEFCENLTNITIPSSVTTIGTDAFDQTGLTSVVIPDSVTTVGSAVFFCCKSLESVTLSKNITSLGQQFFDGCTSLNSITFGGTVEEWKQIELDRKWNEDVPATYVQCSDGQVSLS